MLNGPTNLPLPSEPDWWAVPHHNIYLTPRQAFRHYAPWRTGEAGERQGKPWWMLPIWFVLFPYNMLCALSWWLVCITFKVKPAEPPPEAFEGETGPVVTAEMAWQGIRPEPEITARKKRHRA